MRESDKVSFEVQTLVVIHSLNSYKGMGVEQSIAISYQDVLLSMARYGPSAW